MCTGRRGHSVSDLSTDSLKKYDACPYQIYCSLLCESAAKKRGSFRKRWQTTIEIDSSYRRRRSETLKYIQNILSQTVVHDDLLLKMVKVLDAQIYKMAPSFGSYANRNTLQLRIRLLAMNIGKSIETNKKTEIQQKDGSVFDCVEENTRCITTFDGSTGDYQGSCQECLKYFTDKVRKTGEMYASERCHELNRLIGNDSFIEMMELVSKVLNIRAKYSIERQSCCILKTEMDNEVRSIFLRTPLIDAVKRVGAYNTSTVDMERVHNVNWELLVAEAKVNVQRFEMRMM